MNTLTMTIQCSCPDAPTTATSGSDHHAPSSATVAHAPDCLLGSLDEGQTPRTRLSPGQRRALAVLESAGLHLTEQRDDTDWAVHKGGW